jgi:hypothetical protein
MTVNPDNIIKAVVADDRAYRAAHETDGAFAVVELDTMGCYSGAAYRRNVNFTVKHKTPKAHFIIPFESRLPD